MTHIMKLARITCLALPLILFGCSSGSSGGGGGSTGEGPGGVACGCASGQSCGFDACGNSCGTCGASDFCTAGQCQAAEGCDLGAASGLLNGFDAAGSAAFLRRSGGVERIYFQATSKGTDPDVGPAEPPFSRIVIEYSNDLFASAATGSNVFDLAGTGTKDCELCVRGNSLCNVDKCAWDYVVDEGEIEFFSTGVDDGTGTCGAGSGSGTACETEADCPGDGAEA
ncbi:MAG: hypothetical protein VX938_12540, partial [Myxococcota bacterium]|nr:hypothetical protein [Myxococcota bacterium]